MDEYKGIYYGDSTEPKFFEGGAHFKYKDLYRCLEKIYKQQTPISYNNSGKVKIIFLN